MWASFFNFISFFTQYMQYSSSNLVIQNLALMKYVFTMESIKLVIFKPQIFDTLIVN